MKTIKWVDLGHDVLYAENDFPIDDELLSIDDINDIELNLPSGISIMNKNEYKWIQDNCKIIKYQNDKFKNSKLFNSICCMNNMGYIHFNLPLDIPNQAITYYIKQISSEVNLYTHIEVNEIGIKKFPSYLGTTKTITKLKSDNDKKIYNLKLVKLK